MNKSIVVIVLMLTTACFAFGCGEQSSTPPSETQETAAPESMPMEGSETKSEEAAEAMPMEGSETKSEEAAEAMPMEGSETK